MRAIGFKVILLRVNDSNIDENSKNVGMKEKQNRGVDLYRFCSRVHMYA